MMNEEIRHQILVFLSDKIRQVENDKRLSEMLKAQKVLDLCNAMDEIEDFKKPQKEEFSHLVV